MLYDAHCHPTDTMASIEHIGSLEAAGICVMATRDHDQELVSELALRFPQKVIPCFGYHPWFIHKVYDDRAGQTRPAKADHLRAVIRPSPDDAFIATIPELVPLSQYLATIEEHLLKHPLAMVGEVGLDKSFRIPDLNNPRQDSARSHLSKYKTELDHQSTILRAQLALAGQHGRACSIHGVQAHGMVFEQISSLWKGHELPSKSKLKKEASERRHQGQSTVQPNTRQEASSGLFPPRICLHSYSGNSEMVTTWLNPRIPAKIYFSFSQVINGRYDRWAEVVRSIPDDRILIESDYHDCRMIDNSLAEALDFVRKAKGWERGDAEAMLQGNWQAFVYGY